MADFFIGGLEAFLDTPDKNKIVVDDPSSKKLIPKESIEYPFLSNDLSEEQIREKFVDLIRNFTPEFTSWHIGTMIIYNMRQLNILELSYLPTGDQLVLVNYDDFWTRYNVITAYFAEKCLIHAKRFDAELTAKEYWDKNANVLANNIIEKKLPITNANLAEQMYYNYKTPGFFYLTHVIGLYRKFNATCVLDMCAGWGNHLVAAFAESLNFYCGVDPSSCMFKVYDEIINFFRKTNKHTKTEMINEPFEDAKIPEKNYDLVLSTPPYFFLEHYSDESSQSDNKFPNLDDWYEKFLMFSLRKAWGYLKPGGYLAVNINDINLNFVRGKPNESLYAEFLEKGSSIKYVERMIQDINLFPDSIYLGVILTVNHTKKKRESPQPVWLWRKDVILTNNPPFKVINVDNFNIITDEDLPAGTKQRTINFLKGIGSDLLYNGSFYSMQIVYYALAAKLAKKKIYAYFDFKYLKKEHIAIFRARMFGINVLDINMKENKPESLITVPNAKTNENIKNLLINVFKEHIDVFKKVKTIWIPESLSLAEALTSLGLNIKVNMVQICDKIKNENEQIKIYVSDDPCYKKSIIDAPYPSIPFWDSKVYIVAKKYGAEEDWIFNNGSLINNDFALRKFL